MRAILALGRAEGIERPHPDSASVDTGHDKLAAEQRAGAQPAGAVCRNLMPGERDVEILGILSVDRRRPPFGEVGVPRLNGSR